MSDDRTPTLAELREAAKPPKPVPVPTTKGEVTIKETFQFGPAMTALNERRRTFVILWNNSGHKNAADCARRAGYSENINTSYVQANRLLSDPRIQAAIVEDQRARLIGMTAAAREVINEVMKNPQAPPRDRLKAADMVMNRTGLGATTHHEVNVNIRTDQQKDALIAALAGKLGIDPQTLLGTVVDAEFEDVTEDDEVTELPPIPGLEGLA